VEVALQSDGPNAARANGCRAAAVAAISIGVLIMIWLDVVDFDRASQSLARFLPVGHAFPSKAQGLDFADLAAARQQC
jgi:hypothetical protein